MFLLVSRTYLYLLLLLLPAYVGNLYSDGGSFQLLWLLLLLLLWLLLLLLLLGSNWEAL